LPNAKRANALAQTLAKGLQKSNRVRLSNPVQANEIFAIMPRSTFNAVTAAGAYFYEWPMDGLADDDVHCRFVLSFATPEEHVEQLLSLMLDHA
jgi:threonine aldolase